jgi:hypothetical protein
LPKQAVNLPPIGNLFTPSAFDYVVPSIDDEGAVNLFTTFVARETSLDWDPKVIECVAE